MAYKARLSEYFDILDNDGNGSIDGTEVNKTVAVTYLHFFTSSFSHFLALSYTF